MFRFVLLPRLALDVVIWDAAGCRRGQRLAAGGDPREELAVEAVNHVEIEGHLVALVWRDRASEVPALGLAYDDLLEPDDPIDTNHLERRIRSIPMGRRNRLFCCNVKRTAMLSRVAPALP